MSEAQLIYKKIPEVARAVGAIGKNRENVSQKYSFRGIDDLYNALHEPMCEAGIFSTAEVINSEREERKSSGGGNLIYTILTVRHTFYAEDGSNVSTVTVGEAMDSGDKSSNKSMSAAFKYALMELFCIPTEEKLDTEYDSPEVAPRTQSTAQPRPQQQPQRKPPAADVPNCPRCGGPMWDNRDKKASGETKPNAPDFKCKNKECVDERGYVTATWADSGSNARREAAELDDRMQQAVHEPARTNGAANGHSNGQAKLTPMQELMQYADSIGMNQPTPNELLDILKRQGADFRAVNAGNLAAAKVHVDNFLAGALPDDNPFEEEL